MNSLGKFNFIWRAAKGQAEAEQALYRLGTGIPKSVQQQMVDTNVVNGNIVSSLLTGSSWEKQKLNRHWEGMAKFFATNPNPQKFYAPENASLLKSSRAYLCADSIYVGNLGQVVAERFKTQKNLTPEQEKERDTAITKFNTYMEDLNNNIITSLYQGDKTAFELDMKMQPSPAAQVYMDSLIQVAKSGNFQLSTASQIACVLGWAKMSQYFYVEYKLYNFDMRGTVFFEMYLKPNLSTKQPVDEKLSYLDQNGIEWARDPHEKASNAPILSVSARRLVAGIQAWISDGSIDYEMYLAIQREARIFFQHEAMFAEYAENPSQEVVDTITEKYFQALKRPTEDPSKK